MTRTVLTCRACGYRGAPKPPVGEVPYWRKAPELLNQLVTERPELDDFPGMGPVIAAAIRSNA